MKSVIIDFYAKYKNVIITYIKNITVNYLGQILVNDKFYVSPFEYCDIYVFYIYVI